MNSTLLVYSFVSTLRFVPYSIFISSIFRQLTTEDREIRKIRGDKKDASRGDEEKVKISI